jgi:mRNA interferase YafQ
MLQLVHKSQFKKDFKKLRSAGRDLTKLADTIRLLQGMHPLPGAMRDHQLSGNYGGHRECHLAPDWLLIYRIEGDCLVLVRTGSHSELF